MDHNANGDFSRTDRKNERTSGKETMVNFDQRLSYGRLTLNHTGRYWNDCKIPGQPKNDMTEMEVYGKQPV